MLNSKKDQGPLEAHPHQASKILVVDDEPAILLGLQRQLTARNYTVRGVEDGKSAMALIGEKWPDLVILDLMLPDQNGLEIIYHVRLSLNNQVPIIVLSAREEETQKVQALDMGANDYLTKPFSTAELLARVRVALRPYQKPSPFHTYDGTSGAFQVLGDSHLMIDPGQRLVMREGKEIKLTPKQYDLLIYLAVNSNKLITHNMLLNNVWGSKYIGQTQYLHVFIGQLRHKIELNPAKPRFIVTAPGVGYRFRLNSDEE